jgi:hypothetical protein
MAGSNRLKELDEMRHGDNGGTAAFRTLSAFGGVFITRRHPSETHRS